MSSSIAGFDGMFMFFKKKKKHFTALHLFGNQSMYLNQTYDIQPHQIIQIEISDFEITFFIDFNNWRWR